MRVTSKVTYTLPEMFAGLLCFQSEFLYQDMHDGSSCRASSLAFTGPWIRKIERAQEQGPPTHLEPSKELQSSPELMSSRSVLLMCFMFWAVSALLMIIILDGFPLLV